MKFLFVIFTCGLFISCNQEELDRYNEAYFIDLIKNQIELNNKMVQNASLSVDAMYSKPVDVKVCEGMSALKTGRDKLLDETLLNNFEYLNDTLISEYQSFISKFCKEDDSFAVMEIVQKELISIRELNQLQKTPNKFEKIIWAYQCVILENTLLECYIMQIWFGRRKEFYSFSDTENIAFGKPYEVIFVPEKRTYESPSNFEIIYEGFTFFKDSVETKIDYEFEQVGLAGVVSFVPPKNGQYRIEGDFYVRFYDDNLRLPFPKMIHSFEVN
jgi:hypothetical protein